MIGLQTSIQTLTSSVTIVEEIAIFYTNKHTLQESDDNRTKIDFFLVRDHSASTYIMQKRWCVHEWREAYGALGKIGISSAVSGELWPARSQNSVCTSGRAPAEGRPVGL